ncbi:DUF6258 family protein [Sinorhizobium medicae]|uniref:DUF6258 family protein n=1 Tax=Sinorhizobium medicae TaxID=110321 RepID=UPI00037EBA99|nr:DUF6258 family protein [Sinorhizobium medicae]WQO44131.1 DUF6258 family protein [Sinorhizobium medicae]WQO66891.1 DUF6258 family protein [Sinorhizobium medicae]WQO71282.1 DUF6258 family protein [Sinorhizobium medicae]WQO90701.1 DUF6258 family protein [Sinorhizobium medicae]
MKADEFLESVYLGDRACKAIVLDGWSEEVKIRIDSISRLRSGTWNYDENVRDGFLVFEGVDHISFDPPGRIPNDEIGAIEFLGFEGDRFTVVVEIGSGYELGNYVNVKTTIRAKAVAIERPGEEGARIRE